MSPIFQLILWIFSLYSLALQDSFVNNGLGMIISYDKDDLLITTVDYRDGRPNGDAYSYNKREQRITQKRLYLHGDEIDRTMFHSSPIVGDLVLGDGSRWHGEVENGVTMGRGELVDGQGNIVFVGQMFFNKRYGYGISYKEGVKEYDGDWAMNVRMGNGCEFDSNGQLVRKGVWINNHFCEPTLEIMIEPTLLTSHLFIETFHIGDNVLNDIMEIDFSIYVLLQDLRIGKSSLKELLEMNLNSLNLLKHVEIGDNSMTLCIKWQSPSTLPPALRQQDLQGKTISMNENRIKKEMKKFAVMNCAKLETIKLGDNTCSDYYSIFIESVILFLIGIQICLL